MMEVPYNPRSWFWIVPGDNTRAFSSAVGAYVDASQADPERTTNIETEADMIAVLREANVPPYHRVAKSTVMARLGEDKSTEAMSMASEWQVLRWNAPDKPAVNADDVEVIGLVQAVGPMSRSFWRRNDARG